MTTGRINQVTIVCRGWPTGALFQRRREFQVTGWRPRARPLKRYWPGLQRRVGQSAFPLSVPQGVLPPHRCPGGRCGLGAPGGGLSAQLLPLRCPPRVVASRCSGFRRDQRPAIHRAHPAAVGASPSRCIPGIPSTACTRRSRFRGGRPATVNPPAARHGACKLV